MSQTLCMSKNSFCIITAEPNPFLSKLNVIAPRAGLGLDGFQSRSIETAEPANAAQWSDGYMHVHCI